MKQTYKIAGVEWRVVRNSIGKFDYFILKGDPNAFDYEDTIMLHNAYAFDRAPNIKAAYTLHRYLAPWKLRKACAILCKIHNKEFGLNLSPVEDLSYYAN